MHREDGGQWRIAGADEEIGAERVEMEPCGAGEGDWRREDGGQWRIAGADEEI